MKKIRIAVAVDSEGRYVATAMEEGKSAHDVLLDMYLFDVISEPWRISIVEAEVPLPEIATVMGELARPDNG